MEDTEIVDLYLKRDEHAIKETSVKYGVKLRSLSFRLSGSKDISEECENDTYMKAWETIPRRSQGITFSPISAGSSGISRLTISGRKMP